MQDLPEGPWLQRRLAQDSLRDFFGLHGYRILDPPILEPTELYLRKSGGALASRMYSLTDSGGNLISLRPEFTSSIIRHFLEGGWGTALPLRVQYSGPVFRQDGGGIGYRQFAQIGAELLGSSGALPDAEIVTLAAGSLSLMGIEEYGLTIGDLSVLRRVLEPCRISERAVAFIMANVPDLKEGPEGLARAREKAERLQILSPNQQHAYLAQAVEGLDEEKSRELLQGLLQWASPDLFTVGQRDPSEIVGRLLQKARGVDDPGQVERGLEMACKLACIKGAPEVALAEARELVSSWGGDSAILEPLEQLFQLVEKGIPGQAKVSLDFGLSRDLAYYTGIIFEVKLHSSGVVLGGGGRYDGLARALGSPTDVPALGFAYTLEALLEASQREAQDQEGAAADRRTFVWAGSFEAHKRALAVASELRKRGSPAEVEVSNRELTEAISYARDQGYSSVIAVDEDGRTTDHRV